MIDDNRKLWTRYTGYGDLLYKRATGAAPEMESSKALSELLRPIYKPGMSVLDVGCGAGHYLTSFRNRLDPKINYTGVDATEQYVALARRAFGDTAQFHVGDVFNLPFADRSFAIVMCNNLFLHLPPPPLQALAELARITRQYVIVRTLFGQRNYVIQEVRTSVDLEGAPESDADMIQPDGAIAAFSFFNMYTENYFRQLVGRVAGDWDTQIIADTSWNDFDVRNEIANPTATHIVDGKQISGNLILDWRFIILQRKS